MTTHFSVTHFCARLFLFRHAINDSLIIIKIMMDINLSSLTSCIPNRAIATPFRQLKAKGVIQTFMQTTSIAVVWRRQGAFC